MKKQALCLLICAVLLFSSCAGSGKQHDASETTMQIVERLEASYERRLAAAALVAVSMQYPDFALTEICLTKESGMEKHSESGSVYVFFTSEGDAVCIHCVPLSAEREEFGTMDLYTKDLGFATFDEMTDAPADTSAFIKVTADELSGLIEQALLVSVYEH